MKTTLATLLLAALSLSANAQKITIKKDLITVDGQPYAYLRQGEVYEYYVSSPQKQRLFIVRPQTLQDPAGNASYLQFVFTESHKVVETPIPYTFIGNISTSKIARLIYDARLLKDGALDPEAIADFEVNYGAQYSERRQALNRLPIQTTVVMPAVASPPPAKP